MNGRIASDWSTVWDAVFIPWRSKNFLNYAGLIRINQNPSHFYYIPLKSVVNTHFCKIVFEMEGRT